MINNIEKKIIFELSKKEIKWILVSGGILILLPILFTWSDISFISFKDTGDIGDTIGGITAPFLSFFGSILVYMALKAQINANTIINDQFFLQQKKENVQNFENSFFNLMNFHLNIVNSIEKLYDRSKIRRTNKIYLGDDNLEYIAKGKLVFEIEYNKIYPYLEDYYYQAKMYFNDFDEIEFKDNESRLSVFKKIYDVYYSEEIDSQFGNYFRNLYRLIKIIDSYDFYNDNAKKDFEKKYFYTSIIRAQFSDYELKWIFLNGLSKYGVKFKPLIEKYSLLKNINTNDELLSYFVKYYNEKAFSK